MQLVISFEDRFPRTRRVVERGVDLQSHRSSQNMDVRLILELPN